MVISPLVSFQVTSLTFSNLNREGLGGPFFAPRTLVISMRCEGSKFPSAVSVHFPIPQIPQKKKAPRGGLVCSHVEVVYAAVSILKTDVRLMPTCRAISEGPTPACFN